MRAIDKRAALSFDDEDHTPKPLPQNHLVLTIDQ